MTDFEPRRRVLASTNRLANRYRLRTLAVALAVVCGVGAGALAASASAAPTTIFVSTTGTDASSCGNTLLNACATIDGALNPSDGAAQTGDTVLLAAGTYTEQASLTTAVTLEGAGEGSTIVASPPHGDLTTDYDDPYSALPQRAIVFVNTANKSPVTIEDLTIDAANSSTPDDSGTGCSDDLEGIAALNSVVTIQNTEVEHVHLSPSSLEGCQDGVGIIAQYSVGASVTATITNDTVSDYQKGGIVIDGAGESFTITDNTVTNEPDPAIAANGIQVGDGASGTISGNTVSGNECDLASVCGPNPVSNTQSGGILTFDTGGVTITGNTVSGNDDGILQEDFEGGDPITVTDNTLSDNRYVGLFAGAGTTNASGNTITGSDIGVDSASFSSDPADATLNLTGNVIQDNGTGLEVDTDSNSDPFHPVVTAHDNVIGGGTLGIVNNTDQPVNALDDLVSCSSNTCNTGTGITSSTPTVKVTATPSSITPGGATAAVTAELVDAQGNVIAAPVVPNGTSVTFATTLGSIGASATTTAGAAASTLTSGSTTGTATVTATIDGVSGTAQVAIASPPAPSTTSSISASSSSGVAPLLAFSPAADLSLLIRNPGSELTVFCVDGCGATVTGSIALKEKHGKHKTLSLSSTQLTAAADGSSVYTLTLTKRQRSAIKHAKGAVLTLNASAKDDVTGKTTTGTKTYVLTRS